MQHLTRQILLCLTVFTNAFRFAQQAFIFIFSATITQFKRYVKNSHLSRSRALCRISHKMSVQSTDQIGIIKIHARHDFRFLQIIRHNGHDFSDLLTKRLKKNRLLADSPADQESIRIQNRMQVPDSGGETRAVDMQSGNSFLISAVNELKSFEAVLPLSCR